MGLLDSGKIRKLHQQIRDAEFVIRKLDTQIKELKQDLTDRDIELHQYRKSIGLGLTVINEEQKTAARLAAERHIAIMADLNTLSDALDAQGQTIQAEAQEVKAKMDELTALIAELKNSTADPVKVAALADKIEANTQATRAIFIGDVPPPVPDRGFAPPPGTGT
jgi:prefoldin subunit 5